MQARRPPTLGGRGFPDTARREFDANVSEQGRCDDHAGARPERSRSIVAVPRVIVVVVVPRCDVIMHPVKVTAVRAMPPAVLRWRPVPTLVVTPVRPAIVAAFLETIIPITTPVATLAFAPMIVVGMVTMVVH